MRHRSRITVVDDHVEFLELAGELLEDAGYDVTLLTPDQATVARIVETRPDLIVLDLLLHQAAAEASGWDRFLALRDEPSLRKTPILVCSGDLDALRRRQADLAVHEQVAALAKPFSLDEMEALVADLLACRTSTAHATAPRGRARPT